MRNMLVASILVTFLIATSIHSLFNAYAEINMGSYNVHYSNGANLEMNEIRSSFVTDNATLINQISWPSRCSSEGKWIQVFRDRM